MKENDKNIDKLLKAADEILQGKKPSVSLDTETLSALKQLMVRNDDVPIDAKFKKELDQLIRQNISNFSKMRTSQPHIFKEKFMKYFLTFLTGSFATAIVAVLVLNNYGVVSLPFTDDDKESTVMQMSEDGSMVAMETEVEDVSNKDFGDVPALDEESAAPNTGEDAAIEEAVSSQALPAIGIGGGGGFERSYYPYPGNDLYPPEVTYSYEGSEITIPSEVAIYKNDESTVNTQVLTSLVNNFGVAIEKFMKNGKVLLQNVSFMDESGSINYNIDFNFGQLNFYTFREYDQNTRQPGEKDIPEDSELFRIANTFLREKGFDTSTLNSPIVEKQWLVHFNREKAIAEKDGREPYIYIPREMMVIYPLTIDNIPVVNFGGIAVGEIQLNIDIIDKTVVSGNINLSLNRQRTQYKAQNFSTLKKTLEDTGGTNGFNFGPRPLTLDSPGEELKPSTIAAKYQEAQLAYIQKTNWNQNKTSTFFIPVVMFKGEIEQSDQDEPYDQVTFVPVVSSKEF